VSARAETAAGTAIETVEPSLINPEASGTVSVSFVGDMMFDRGVRKVIEKQGAVYLFTGVKTELKKADILLGNLDCPLTDRNEQIKGKKLFHCAPGMARVLADVGFKGMFLANGRIIDQGLEGITDTTTSLGAVGILGLGVAGNAEIAKVPRVAKLKGIRIAFVAFSDTNVSDSDMMIMPLPFAGVDVKTVTEAVRDAKAKTQADFIIVSFHWGSEFDYFPTENQRKLAYAAVDAGATLVVGHHPHVLQPYEIRNGAFIMYSLGNFIYDQKRTAATESAIMTAYFTKQGMGQVEFIPVVIEDGRPMPVTGERAAKILKIIGGERKVSVFE
jgi:gamma-polyglutamate biosynthesis protein CapA